MDLGANGNAESPIWWPVIICVRDTHVLHCEMEYWDIEIYIYQKHYVDCYIYETSYINYIVTTDQKPIIDTQKT